MSYKLEIRIDQLPACNASRNVNRFVKTRERVDMGILLRSKVPHLLRPEKPLEKAVLTYVRHSSRRPDYDNLVSSYKLIQDLLQPQSKRNLHGIGVIADDRHETIGVPTYQWEPAPRGQGHITIIVEEPTDEDV